MSQNNDRPKVSVIIPAYNVEKYIEKCIGSILSQTYTNLELIVVDDGATDSTPQIIDAAAARDSRLIPIHKENGGVSTARNSGLDVCTGEYVVFVDGDDYLAPDYIEYMLGLAKQTNAGFCLSRNSFTRKGEAQVQEDRVETLTPEDATALLLSPAIIVGCWNKIYKRTLLLENNLRFSSELFYGEGLSFITTAAQRSNAVGVGCRKVYYYRRNNVASATTKFDIEKLYNGEKSLDVIEENMSISSPKIDAMLFLHRSIFALGALVRLLAHKVKSQYKDDYKRWKRFVNRSARILLFKKGISVYRKLLLLGGSICPRVLMYMDIIRRKRIVDGSIE